jgi:hypothetical protein
VLKDHLLKELTPALRKLGFKKKGMTWRRDSGDLIDVVNIQGSRWGGGAFYVNVGIYLGGDSRDPKEYECTFRHRVAHEQRTTAEIVAEAVAWFDRNRADIERAGAPPAAPHISVRVRHSTFGIGTLLSEAEGIAEVAFDDGTTRRIKKTYLEIAPPA